MCTVVLLACLPFLKGAVNAVQYNKPHANQRSFLADSSYKTIHILVALCDNKYQGIVPVPAGIGNGQNPNTNLYWGCGYGVRNYFKKSKEWTFLESRQVDSTRPERLIFRHVSKPFYLIADAYDGKKIRECTLDFLRSSSGEWKDSLKIRNKTLGLAGHANLIVYIGHDGLMDFSLDESFRNTDKRKRDVAILACYSKRFFSPHLRSANVNPILWTTHLMCPEAYTIHDALSGYVQNETNEQVRTRAAKAYSRYLKCSEKAARKLLVTGW